MSITDQPTDRSIPDSPISRLLGDPDRLIPVVAEHLAGIGWPPAGIAPMADVHGTGGLRGEWLLLRTLREHLDDRPAVIPTWTLCISHDDQGRPVDARLVRGPDEVVHDGLSGFCPKCPADASAIDFERDGLHCYLEPVADASASLDPETLVLALIEAHNKLFSERHDLAVGTWRDAAAEMIAKRKLVPPPDLLPLLADDTIQVRGARTLWLHTAGVLVRGKVSIECKLRGEQYEVRVVFRDVLTEDYDGYFIARGLSAGLKAHYGRRFVVRVSDTQTKVGWTTGLMA